MRPKTKVDPMKSIEFRTVEQHPSHVSHKTCSDPVTKPFERDERAVADDRRWFAAHPYRAHRIRPPGIGERQTMRGQHPGTKMFVVVRQVEPGVRVRQPVWLTRTPPKTEPVAHAIFDLALQAATAGGDFIPPDVVRQRVLMLAEGGRA
jgi:hypothetical protein